MTGSLSNNEHALLSELKNGNEKAFEQIYHLYSPRLYGNIFKMLKSETETSEILQDVFIKIWDNRQNIDPDKSFRSYLFRIAENRVYDFFRKAARDREMQARLLAAATMEYEHIESAIFTKENSAILEKAISNLPPQRQKVFRLCKLEGKSYEEVGQLLGISASTISDHIVKATKSVKEYFFSNPELLIVIIAVM